MVESGQLTETGITWFLVARKVNRKTQLFSLFWSIGTVVFPLAARLNVMEKVVLIGALIRGRIDVNDMKEDSRGTQCHGKKPYI